MHDSLTLAEHVAGRAVVDTDQALVAVHGLGALVAVDFEKRLDLVARERQPYGV